jgi:signal transduction histidine kinase
VVRRHPGVQVTGQAAWVRGNAEQLASAVDNLLDNAAHHGAAPIHVHLWVEGHHTGFDVSDRGEGISEGNADKVFRRFFTTRRDHGGTGLGLALVRAITRVHGGDTTLEQRANPTTFRVRLPRS